VRNDEPILRDILNHTIKTITQKDIDNIVNKYVTIVVEKNTTFAVTFWILAILILIVFVILLWNYMLNEKVKQEIKKNEEQQLILIEQNKKAELGNLIGNISHQWRDSLAKIGYINLNLMIRVSQKKDLPIDLIKYSTSEIEKSLDFMSETMQNFLDYYKPSTKITTFEAYDSIKNALNIIDAKIKNSNVSIEFLGDFSTKITGIKNEWMQIWINLIINSINIALARKIDNPKITIHIDNEFILFQDNCGKIETNLLKEINKKQYTGLGIKMAREISKKNNKKMIIYNGKEGAVFKFIELKTNFS
jgi:signal transduction histidine kinase